MDKYLCTCGIGFSKKKIADVHEKSYIEANDSSLWPHKIMKRHWRGRLVDWLLRWPVMKIFKLIGVLMIYFVLVHHFWITFNLWEATFMGIGLGLAIE